uniref:Phosphoenolpyruvate--protein phosphotransferase n=1 Tax=Desertifilum tharense IPPAS B-1220 TaxID=1781255 RepID=A0ACD5GQJ3_9CYAN
MKGICTVSGSATSHSGILARSLGLPAIVGLSSQLLRLQPGTLLAMNGDTGELWIEPPPAELRQLEQKQQRQTQTTQPAVALSTPTATRDGHRVKLMANINTLTDAQAVKGSGAEGVGLLRSEFLFLDRTTLPTEAEQVAIYQEIAAAVAPEPLFIRLLDIGGDKPLPYLKLPSEANPFLGYRGIRVLLDRPELLKTQLKAILRVSHQYAVKAILPMVSAIAEVQAVQEILSQAQLELQQANVGFHRQLEIGIMIEVPAAVNLSDQLAGVANFFSIGTNDLTQYVMASDRNNAQVAHLADAFAPAILRNIQQTVTNAHRAGIPVCVCGELAAYREAIPILIGLGVDEFSLPVSVIPQLKRLIAQIDGDEAGAIASAVLNLDSGVRRARICSQSLFSSAMTRQRLIIEMGMGIDQHGQDPTVAAQRAVRNAIAHNALPGVWEVAGLNHPNQMIVEVQVAVPYPEQVREAEVLAVLPFGQKSLTLEKGGMVVQGRAIPELNDKNDDMIVAVAVPLLSRSNGKKIDEKTD